MTKNNRVGGGNSSSRLQAISVITPTTENKLTSRQLTDYEEHRRLFIEWLLNLGKNSKKAKGYATETTRVRASRADQFYRWVWDEEDRYTTAVTHEHADEYMKELAYEDETDGSKANKMKAIKTLFRWRAFELGDEKWEPEIKFSNHTSATNPKDYFTVEERKKLREASLEYGSVPHYNSITPEQRERWKEHLAQRFEKSKDDVGPDDFDRANSWKYPSLVWSALDAGLRPVEVKRSTVKWVDTQNCVLRIPKEESSKNEDNWVVSLTDRTANALERWLGERQQYEKYDDSDAIWLTRDGNPYESYSLNYLLKRVCDDAGIETENRKVTWYSIRHSVGTYMTREEGLAAAQAQLRHKSPETTLRYDQTPPKERRDALNKMG
jgi:integrase